MSQRGSGRIEVGPDDALPDLLLRVKATRGDEVTIALPESSAVLLTASEFRTLKTTADQVRVAITLETNDKLRSQLAGMFGFAHAPLLSDDQLEVVDEHPSWPIPDSRLVPSRVSVPAGDLVTSKPWREEAVDASSGISVPPRPVPRPEFALEPRTGAIAKQEPEARAKTSPMTIVAIIAGIVAALGVAAVLSVVLRTAEIRVRMPRTAVSAPLTVAYSTDGADIPGAALTLPATSTQFTVPYSAQQKATGTLDNQGGHATGTVQLRNISGGEVTLPGGTRLQMADGFTYLTTQDVSIPSGDTESPGRATVPIQAEKAGTAGNRNAGSFTGQVPNVQGVYFGNPGSPISGGTDNLIAVVTDRDLADARTTATTKLTALAQAFQLPDGRVVIPSTVQPVGDPVVEADHVAGDQVDSFNITGQATFQALTIDPDDLPENVRSEIRHQIEVSVPDGYALTDESISFAEPVETAPGSGTIDVMATIDAAELLTPEMTAQIRELAHDKSQSEANTALSSVQGIEVTDISVSPSLLVTSLPGAGKIDVVAE